MLAACTKTLICSINLVRDQNGATGNLKSELGLPVGCNRLACLWKQAVKIHYDPLSSSQGETRRYSQTVEIGI